MDDESGCNIARPTELDRGFLLGNIFIIIFTFYKSGIGPKPRPMPPGWRRRPLSCIALSLNPSLNTSHVRVRRPLGSGVATMPKPKPELSY